MVLAAGGLPSGWLVLATLVGGSLAAGSANALNCWYDRDIDAVMHRTERRPLARHVVSPRNALVFGLVLGVVATVELALTTNLLSAVLADAAIAFYVVVYTMVLKRRTSQNIVWGGAAGCMPVLIGWSAVTGTVSWAPVGALRGDLLLDAAALLGAGDAVPRRLRRGRRPDAAVVATPAAVARRIVAYSWVMVATSLLLWLDASGPVYGVSAVVLGGVFLREAHALARAGTPRRGRRADAAVPLVDHLPRAALPRRRGRPARLMRRPCG